MLKKLTQKRNKKGFTLVELVVVIAILGILALIAVPRLSGFTDRAAIKADQATAASIGKAAELYLLDVKPDENGVKALPSLEDLQEADLIKDKTVKAQSTKKVFILDGTAKDIKVKSNDIEFYPDYTAPAKKEIPGG